MSPLLACLAAFLLIDSVSTYLLTTRHRYGESISNTKILSTSLTIDELELVRVISAKESTVGILDNAVHKIINYYNNNNYNLNPSKIWIKLIRSINRIIVYSNASTCDKEKAMDILASTLERFTKISPNLNLLKLNDLKAILVMIRYLNASAESNKRLVQRLLPILLENALYSSWNEILLNLWFQVLIAYDHVDVMIKPHTNIKSFLESNPYLMRVFNARTVVILLQYPRLDEADINWIYSLSNNVGSVGTHDMTLVNNSYIGALLRHNTSTCASSALQMYANMVRTGSADAYTINSILGYHASLKYTVSNHKIINTLYKSFSKDAERKSGVVDLLHVDIYTTLINYYSSKDVRSNINNWFDISSSYAMTALECHPSNTSNIIRPLITSFSSYWRSYDAIDSTESTDGTERSLLADCSVIQSILEYTTDISLWSIAIATPLSRGEFRLASNLLHTYRKVNAVSHFDSARTASKLLELSVYQAIDPAINVLNPTTKNVIVDFSDVSISVSGVMALLKNTTQLVKTDLRTSLTLGDVVSFLEYCVLPSNEDDRGEELGIYSHEKLPIGINILNRIFVDAIDNRQYSSGARVLKILEKASRLVLDMDKDSFSNHYMNRSMSADNDFSVHRVKDTIARRWTALLVGKSIKSIQNNFINSMKIVK